MTIEERQKAIKKGLIDNNKTLTGIARSAGLRREYFHLIINGQRTGYKYRAVIADACGLPFDYLWPDTPQQYRRAA